MSVFKVGNRTDSTPNKNEKRPTPSSLSLSSSSVPRIVRRFYHPEVIILWTQHRDIRLYLDDTLDPPQQGVKVWSQRSRQFTHTWMEYPYAIYLILD